MYHRLKTIRDIVSPSTIEKFNEIICSQLKQQLTVKDHLGCGDHMLFFNPGDHRLSSDGYYSYLTPRNASGRHINFKRRMWVQGSLEFFRPIEYGKEYVCQENIIFVKKIRHDHFLRMSRDVTDIEGYLKLREFRTLVYTDSEPALASERSDREVKADALVRFTFTDVDIMKYSCLTSNTHRIHWDLNYCKNFEGYRDILVQGPFTAQLIMKVLELENVSGIKSIKYKNSNIIYRGTSVEVCVSSLNGGNVFVWIRDATNPKITYVESTVQLCRASA
ncbi:hydroxyacyl-thioester dehydratase HTD2 Ecym_3220 [Eremothecium cymbalariae DBVPG|uniref:MaoC-like domain-containing protein n=1 Tax=Eremothecium cymbalariae (strain CBS 270.75 / DBVPG 7215 / KCTC 17166 / NRRL Y-17582) TaxID=931890 RepID=G8JRE8_ERECY|nr:Hypothetical protein Ecym_3220 [Eremothecium cymbalariae DBVPG\